MTTMNRIEELRAEAQRTAAAEASLTQQRREVRGRINALAPLLVEADNTINTASKRSPAADRVTQEHSAGIERARRAAADAEASVHRCSAAIPPAEAAAGVKVGDLDAELKRLREERERIEARENELGVLVRATEDLAQAERAFVAAESALAQARKHATAQIDKARADDERHAEAVARARRTVEEHAQLTEELKSLDRRAGITVS